MKRTVLGRAWGLAAVVGIGTVAVGSALAGPPLSGPPPRYIPTTALPAGPPRSARLGQFYPAPQLFVRGNFPAGGGYTPGDSPTFDSLALYGPLSALRPASAPIMTYARGYDGTVRPMVGTSISYPNLPEIAPVVYPTWRNDYYYGYRNSGIPPWWNNGINWIDQN